MAVRERRLATEATHARATLLTVHEIFTSIQGETSASGRPCTFVRLTACDLRCTWCDTPRAFHEGTPRAIEEIVGEVSERGVGFVTVTGGEPLLQAGCAGLVSSLLDAGFEVQVETGGHRPFAHLDRRARVILDVKLPGSGEHGAVRWEGLDELEPHDEVKMVVATREDYDVARSLVTGRLRGFGGEILLQPATGLLPPVQLAEWIVADALPVRLTLQLHAVLWPGRSGV